MSDRPVLSPAPRATSGRSMLARWFLAPLLATVLAACGGSGETGTDRSGAEGGGDRLLAGVTLQPVMADGSALDFEEPGDLPMVVNLWATWCEPCRVEMPTFDEVATELDGKVRFVGVNVGDEADVAMRFVEETGVSFDQFLDPNLHVQTEVGAITMPSTAFLDEGGRLVHLQSGVMDRAALLAQLDSRFGIAAS